MLAGCGKEDEPRECVQHAAGDYDAQTGWQSADYCAVPTDLGCYPFRKGSDDACGDFVTMRTHETADSDAAACRTMLQNLNCGQYRGDDADLTFHVADPERFSMHVTGTFRGVDVDTKFFFNPCQPGCQAAIVLDTIDDSQQKICEIPNMGNPQCLFPESAHTLTFVRADAGSMVVRTAGKESVLSRGGDG